MKLYPGALTIQLQPSLSVKLTSDYLLTPKVSIENHNGLLYQTTTMRKLVINSIQDISSKGLSKLGRQFPFAAYMMMSLDTNTPSIWATNPATCDALVPVGEDGYSGNIGTGACKESVVKKSGNTAAGPSNIFSNENSENGAQAMFSATITDMVIGMISSLAFLLPALIVTNMKRRNVAQRHVKPRFKGKSPSPYSGPPAFEKSAM